MDDYQLVATISLVTQIVVLVLLFGGIWLKGKKKYRQHGIMMFTAVVLHTVVMLAWMIPKFSSLLSSPSTLNPVGALMVAILVHAFMGIATVILGFWLVASWRLQVDVKACFAKKKAMRVTLTLWLITLVLGIILYLKIVQGF
ncbi:hypothetical protein MUP38_04500 [Candidatus Bathyarchaeota archaeon]|nr:hypothetical protein [Candidatus Bathyarchaeota archaeon]